MNAAAARARANIALVKYWGKRDVANNLPATGSLSMTLSSLATETRVTFDAALQADEVVLNGTPAPETVRLRTSRFLDRVRSLAGVAGDARTARARVETANSFPTASGLASSASGFAALALAATRAAGLDLPLASLATLARAGSGSAPRSLIGGFVELPAGSAPTGSDCVPVQVAPPDHWDLGLVVAVNGRARKDVGSTEGMERTRATSPFYPAWLARNAPHLAEARSAILARDLAALGRVVEASCFSMHAVALSAAPPILYWNGVTVDAVHRVWALRAAGLQGYVTIDAGPHVKVLCRAADAGAFACELRQVPGVVEVRVERPGPGAEVVS
ncbi:MAG: diphosphomevalonate decarboxylase [Deltaproteobacteria bacterium]|nr:diphosphomevalonate decarboxylase [Deltaproteobacteria bacterium]